MSFLTSRQQGLCARFFLKALACVIALGVSINVAPLLTSRAYATTQSSLETQAEAQVQEAQAYELQDQDGTVLASHNADEQLPMASITKIMTAIVALDSNKDLDEPCTISDRTYQEGAQLIGLSSLDTPSFRELLLGMLIYSGNDAADQVALHVAGNIDAFVALMNQKAQELGMNHTHFMNPHGLEEANHYSSAHDLTVMGRYALENYPFIARAVMTHTVDLEVGGQRRTFFSTDKLMGSYAGLCGIKTGKVESGTSFLGSSKRHGVQLFSCVLGCSSDEGRFEDTARLMDWAYDSYLKRVSFTRRSWILATVPWQDGFWGRLLVRSSWDTEGRSYPGADINYETHNSFNGLLVGPSQAYDATAWTQEGRFVAVSVTRTSSRPCKIPTVNIFSLPLFIDVDQLQQALEA